MKRLFQIGLGVLVVGLIDLGFGYWNHGNKSVKFNNNRRPEIIQQTASSKKQTIHISKNFNRMKLNITTADVKVTSGDKFQIIYHGTNKPQISVKNGQAIINQSHVSSKHWTKFSGISFMSVESDTNDEITIVIPKNEQISGSLYLSEGDLIVNDTSLSNLNIKLSEGDANFSNVLVTGGKLSLTEGDFNARHLTVNKHFKVENDEGDNTVMGIKADGYYLSADEGDNDLFSRSQEDGGKLMKNFHAANILSLSTSEGDNTVK